MGYDPTIKQVPAEISQSNSSYMTTAELEQFRLALGQLQIGFRHFKEHVASRTKVYSKIISLTDEGMIIYNPYPQFFSDLVFPAPISATFETKEETILIPPETLPLLYDYVVELFPLLYPTPIVVPIKLHQYFISMFPPNTAGSTYEYIYFGKANDPRLEETKRQIIERFGGNIRLTSKQMTVLNPDRVYRQLWEQHVSDPLIALGLGEFLYNYFPEQSIHELISGYLTDQAINEFRVRHIELLDHIQQQLDEVIPVKELREIIELYADNLFHYD